MTDPFEQTVRAALESLLIQQQGEDSPNPESWDSGYAAHQAKYLAPRVAAAFRQTVDGEDAQAQEDFVAALRGGPGTEKPPATDRRHDPHAYDDPQCL